MGVHCCCLHLNYIVYEHFDRSLHVGSSDPTYIQNFRPVPLMVFEILGFKLKNENNKISQSTVALCIQVNEKSCRLRMATYRDGVKRKGDKIGMGV